MPQISSWNEHPSVNATGLYKFTSIEINVNSKMKITTRNTYDILSWLGDVGGLVDCLLILV